MVIDESIIELKTKISNLPEKHRAIMALRIAGYSQKECGAIVGLTGSAVGLIYKKTLNKLRNEVSDGNES